MSESELDAKIQPVDPTGHNRCHCGAKAKWTASLRLEGAQVRPSFQHEDLCKEHAEQLAAVHKLRFPSTDQPSALGPALLAPAAVHRIDRPAAPTRTDCQPPNVASEIERFQAGGRAKQD